MTDGLKSARNTGRGKSRKGKARDMREKCCCMVLHGGRPCPEQVVGALTEVEAERDAAFVRAEVAEAKAERLAELVFQSYAEGYNKAAVTLLGTALGPAEVDMKRAWLISHAFVSRAAITAQEDED